MTKNDIKRVNQLSLVYFNVRQKLEARDSGGPGVDHNKICRVEDHVITSWWNLPSWWPEQPAKEENNCELKARKYFTVVTCGVCSLALAAAQSLVSVWADQSSVTWRQKIF